MSETENYDFARLMIPVAIQVMGCEPNANLSNKEEIRFGNHGSLSINFARGVWCCHENGRSGGVLDFLHWKKGLQKEEAISWLRDNKYLPQKTITGTDILVAYDYTDENGNLVAQVCRMHPKNFRQRRPNPADPNQWIWKTAGLTIPLYRLPELTKAIADEKTIYIAEGEKAVDALCGLKLCATCSPGGAGKWRDHHTSALRDADVVILPDNDQPGRDHALKVALALRGIAKTIRIVALPGLPEKGDAFDWIEAGGTREKLEALVEQSAAQSASQGDCDAVPDVQSSDLVLTPAAPLLIARTFIEQHYTRKGQRILQHQNATFFSWTGTHYIEVTHEELRAELYQFLAKAKCKTSEGNLIPFHPNKSKVGNALEAVGAEAQLPSIARPPVWLDNRDTPNPAEIIACKNGMLHLRLGTISEHTPLFFNMNALEFDYAPDAPAPQIWLQFLETLWPNDSTSIETLQEIFGLLLTGETRHQKAFLLIGPKRSGKGTIARVLTRLLGQANVCGPTLSGLGQNFGVAPLIGKRLAVISDARLGGKVDQHAIVERILAITGEDSLTVDRKYREAWTGRLETRFLILSNELPRLSDASGALASRFITLVLKESFYGKEDHGLTDRLMGELPGILNWAISGWHRLQARGYFIPPASSAEAQQELEDLGSPISAFLRDRCILKPGCGVRADTLFNAWRDWCKEQGRDHAGTVQTFGRDLRAAVPSLTMEKPRGSDGERIRYYCGVELG